jgi:hypothetical protein
LFFHPIPFHCRILLAKASCSREGQGKEAVRRGEEQTEGGLWVILWMTGRLADSGICIQVAMLTLWLEDRGLRLVWSGPWAL